ncbi:N-acetylmuramate alpha-1-phosphate uridylyltransferase MurU [Cellvibrio japonicus]|uniref:Nucleotidyltransferase family protein n=1 Tax=Cellvibrio japonicus (strain Ueda107) TaxID=498211 RepID=B3PKU9_CELJU|nr:nucleotidyltransferase family protein [Cellvibrio japonicus]ACE85574.1 nucleotidyltransferase family protein [Cellvibrio japonicus Ueda107]QEI11508.1 nucleotidyltransferase family protein [Cellvibrio japonicus]QEI15082.1 nucleotidyltransferase family protein [Cellvibrio japonicus]QEI18662.1 nucleotidyltransferase family protein [Cellvibrio japonicus]
MKAMILAAGLGQRMRPLTNHLPKPMLPLGGKPLLDYHLEKLPAAGITQVIINLAYLGDKIRAYVGDGQRYGLEVIYSEEPEPLETGGALLKALPLLGESPFLLINGDVWCDLDLRQFSQHRLRETQMGHLLLIPNPDFHPRGDFALGAQQYLLPDPQQQHPWRYTFAGISLLRPELIATYPHRRHKFPLVEVLRHAIDRGQLSAEVHTGQWSDIGTPERLHALEQQLQATATSR